MDWASSWSFQPLRLVPVQSPKARFTWAVPYLATSASNSSIMVGCALSASMSTASLAGEFSLTMTTLLPPGVSDPVWQPDKTSQPGVQGRQNSTGEGGNPPGEPPRSPLGVPHHPGHQTPGGQRGTVSRPVPESG